MTRTRYQNAWNVIRRSLMMMNLLTGLIFFSITFGLGLPVKSEEISNSLKYQWLETESPERHNWIRAANHEVNQTLKISKNRKKVESAFKSLLSLPRVQNPISSDKGSLKIVYRGFGKGSDLVRVNNEDLSEEILFSNLQLAKNGNYTFLNIIPSPDSKYVAMLFSYKGSTDWIHIRLLDLSTKSLIGKSLETKAFLSWINPLTFSIWEEDSTCRQVTLPQFDITNESCNNDQKSNGWKFVTKDSLFVAIRESDSAVVFLPYFTSQIFASNSFIYYIPDDSNLPTTQIFRFSRYGDPVNELFYESHNENIENDLEFDGKTVFLPTNWGGQQKLKIFEEDTKAVLAEISIPDFANFRGCFWENEKKTLFVSLETEVQKSQVVRYDLQTNQFDPMGLKKLLKVDSLNQEIISQIIQVKSEDGTLIPTRVTHLKSLKMNHQNPVYFYVYGGFGVSAFQIQRNPLFLLFLERGGILVHAAIRGGNEFGLDWRKSAQFENKVKTFADVAAVGKTLTDLGYTNPQKIVLSGGSNGGMVVTATAQLYPEVFGLVISNNGVNDMLRRDVLDPAFDKGWSYEYGDLTKDSIIAAAKIFSPVESAKKGPGANFLIINGRKDSRVNPAHSFKLKAALSAANATGKKFVYLMSVNNSGHGGGSSQQDLIAWRQKVVEWSLIYDYLEMTF